jgi:hypothetical protein
MPGRLCLECFDQRAKLECQHCRKKNLEGTSHCIWCAARLGNAEDYEARMSAIETRLLAESQTVDFGDKLRADYVWKQQYGYWISPCARCKETVGTVYATYFRCAAFIRVWQYVATEARLCVVCNIWEFMSQTGYTLLLGWWSIFGFLYTLQILALNTVSFSISMYRWVRK